MDVVLVVLSVVPLMGAVTLVKLAVQTMDAVILVNPMDVVQMLAVIRALLMDAEALVKEDAQRHVTVIALEDAGLMDAVDRVLETVVLTHVLEDVTRTVAVILVNLMDVAKTHVVILVRQMVAVIAVKLDAQKTDAAMNALLMDAEPLVMRTVKQKLTQIHTDLTGLGGIV